MSRFDCACVDVEHFLETLDIRNVRIGPVEATFSCPFPNHANGDNTPSAQMSLETTAWRCYTCKERGNAISFAAGVLGISPLAAIRMLRAAYDPHALDPDAFNTVAAVERAFEIKPETNFQQPVLDEAMLDEYAVDWYAVDAALRTGDEPVPDVLAYMIRERGFGPEILEDWEFGYDQVSGRVIFAVRDEHGTLIGFKGRAHDDWHPKYLVLGDKPGDKRRTRYGFPIYNPSRICFGAHRVDPGGTVVVCEGELNAIAITARTGENAVAINGSFFSEHHSRILRNSADDVVVFLDHDKAGKDATWGWTDTKGIFHPGIVQRLRDHMPVFLAPQTHRDPAEMTGPEIEEALRNAESALAREIAA